MWQRDLYLATYFGLHFNLKVRCGLPIARVVQYGGFSIKYAYYTYLIAKIKYVRNTGLNTAISRARIKNKFCICTDVRIIYLFVRDWCISFFLQFYL